jgi:hypothetical protein
MAKGQKHTPELCAIPAWRGSGLLPALASGKPFEAIALRRWIPGGLGHVQWSTVVIFVADVL